MSVADVDATILKELVDLGPVEGMELVRDLVKIFFEEAPGRMTRLRMALSEVDSNKVAQAAHALRGGAAGLGAVGLANICATIERQARAGDLTGLESEISGIGNGLPKLEERIGELIRQLGAQQASA